MFEQAGVLLGLSAACALLGWSIGHLIRGRRPQIEVEHPRLAVSMAYLRDAHNEATSSHTRLHCAYEAIYFCLCEVAETCGVTVEGREHPNDALMRVALAALDAPVEDFRAVALLARWAAENNATMPRLSISEACGVAIRIHQQTASMLSSLARH